NRIVNSSRRTVTTPAFLMCLVTAVVPTFDFQVPFRPIVALLFVLFGIVIVSCLSRNRLSGSEGAAISIRRSAPYSGLNCTVTISAAGVESQEVGHSAVNGL